jgi:hypothetical protein
MKRFIALLVAAHVAAAPVSVMASDNQAQSEQTFSFNLPKEIVIPGVIAAVAGVIKLISKFGGTQGIWGFFNKFRQQVLDQNPENIIENAKQFVQQEGPEVVHRGAAELSKLAIPALHDEALRNRILSRHPEFRANEGDTPEISAQKQKRLEKELAKARIKYAKMHVLNSQNPSARRAGVLVKELVNVVVDNVQQVDGVATPAQGEVFTDKPLTEEQLNSIIG